MSLSLQRNMLLELMTFLLESNDDAIPWNEITSKLKWMFDFDYVDIVLFDEQRQSYHFETLFAPQPPSAHDSVRHPSAEITRFLDFLQSTDAGDAIISDSQDLSGSWQQWFSETGVKSAILASIKSAGNTFGAIRLATSLKGYSNRDLELLHTLAGLLGCLLQRAMHLQRIQEDAALSERGRLAAMQAQTKAELADSMKDQFIAGLSHELRSPLTAILGAAGILMKSTLPDDARLKLAELIQRNARMQSMLVDDLFDTSRMLAGTMNIQAQELDIQNPILAAIENIRLSAESKHIEITVEGVPIPLMEGDVFRLQQVFGNLLGNAVKFTPEYGAIKVRTEMHDGFVQIHVIDNGIGIDKGFLPQVFERWKQAEQRGPSGGLGLGLAIARHVVELHGGFINVESDGLGSGTRFTVTLPISNLSENPRHNVRAS